MHHLDKLYATQSRPYEENLSMIEQESGVFEFNVDSAEQHQEDMSLSNRDKAFA